MPRFPVALNPFQTRVPTTRLGAVGRALNPLNPFNAALIVLEESIQRSPLPSDLKRQASYLSFGLPGLAYTTLERPANAANENKLIQESLRYFAQKDRQKQTGTVAAPPTTGSRVDRATRQTQATQPVAPESPQVIPATLTKPPVFPTTPAGQYGRYFGSPEMDYMFGEPSRTEDIPATVEEMLALAKQTKAPEDTPLATYYRAQSAAGRGQMGEIKKELGYEEGSNMAAWAEANPMLAQRLYAKKMKEREVPISVD